LNRITGCGKKLFWNRNNLRKNLKVCGVVLTCMGYILKESRWGVTDLVLEILTAKGWELNFCFFSSARPRRTSCAVFSWCPGGLLSNPGVVSGDFDKILDRIVIIKICFLAVTRLLSVQILRNFAASCPVGWPTGPQSPKHDVSLKIRSYDHF